MNYRRTYENDRRQREAYIGFKGTRYNSRQIEVIKGQIEDTKVKIGVTKEIITEIR